VRVLLVEPNRSSLRVLEQMLREWDMEPETAADLSAGLAKAAQSPFPLVIADSSLAAPDLLSPAAWAKEDADSRPALIVLVTAADRQTASPQEPAGRVLYLEKPALAGELFSAISRALGGAPGRQGPAPTAPPPPTRRLRVLLAEDTAANRKVVSVVLGKRGHTVDLAADGQQALERVAGRGYDLILMDVQMPVMDGFQATAAIRALDEPKKARLPIVALTAHAMTGDGERCLAAGMDAYVAKPIDAGELVELVERLAGGSPVS